MLLEPHGHDGETYELTGPEALNTHAIAAVLRAATGTHIHYVDTPVATVRDALSTSGMPQQMVTAFLELHSVMASSKRAPVTSHVRQVTGRPSRSFAGFAAEHAAALWQPELAQSAIPFGHRRQAIRDGRVDQDRPRLIR